MPYAEDVASFCKERQKPLMIAESTPFGGIVVGDVDNEAGVISPFMAYTHNFTATNLTVIPDRPNRYLRLNLSKHYIRPILHCTPTN